MAVCVLTWRNFGETDRPMQLPCTRVHSVVMRVRNDQHTVGTVDSFRAQSLAEDATVSHEPCSPCMWTDDA